MHIDYMIGNKTIVDTSGKQLFPGLIRSYVDEPVEQASDWTDRELMMYINAEHRHLFSVVRGLYEDWFMRQWIFSLTPNVFKYDIPREVVNQRRVEYIQAVGVSGTYPNFIVDEIAANPEEVQEVELSGKDNLRHYSSSNRVVRTNGYYMYSDTIQFLDDSRIGPGYYGRMYYLPEAPDLHRAVASTGSTSTTIVFGTNGLTTTLGTISNRDNYYQGMYVEIIYGTGIGQIRKITQYDGATRTATVDTAWVTTPDDTSQYSIVSPIKEDYHELLALGAYFRAKGIKVEDDASAGATQYQLIMKNMIDALERRNHQNPRRVITTQRTGVWY